MPDIFPVSRRQRIEVQRASQTISVLDVGRPGATGPQGPAGPPIQLGTIVGFQEITAMATVDLGGLGVVPAMVCGGVKVWPYATCILVDDGSDWYVVGCPGRCVGWRDDFAHIQSVGGVMHSDQSWNWGTSGAPGGLVAQGVYGGHEQFGCVVVTVAPTTGAFTTFVTQNEALAIPWFTSGGMWTHSRVIIGSLRPNNNGACRIGMMNQQVVIWGAIDANTRGVCASFHPSFHATNWLLEIFNGTSTTTMNTGIAVTDMTPYDIDLLWMPRYTPEGIGGYAGLWIDGTLRAEFSNVAQIPQAFTSAATTMRAGMTAAVTSAVSKAILFDSMEVYSVGPCTVI